MPINYEDDEKFGLTRMTPASIVKLCKKNKLYVTPRLNDVLYMHYQGYTKIESLEPYTGLKCLWLESNAIDRLEGLECQTELRCLFIHNNLIKRLENLEHCAKLDTLNVSHNYITCIENCGADVLPVLNTLNVSHNRLHTLEQLQPLVNCTTVSVLDLSHNRIDDILIVGVLAQMPALRVLCMTGNPVVSAIPMYRKTLINECKELTYLDSRPVFDRDRACALAWKQGGYEEERKEHERWNRADRRRMRAGVNATLALRNRRAIEKGLEPEYNLIHDSDEDDQLAIGGDGEAGGDAAESQFYSCPKCHSRRCKYTEHRCVFPKEDIFAEVDTEEAKNLVPCTDDVSGVEEKDFYDKLVDELNEMHAAEKEKAEQSIEGKESESKENVETDVDPSKPLDNETDAKDSDEATETKEAENAEDLREKNRELIKELFQAELEKMISKAVENPEEEKKPLEVVTAVDHDDDYDDYPERTSSISDVESESMSDDDDDEEEESDEDEENVADSKPVQSIRGFLNEYNDFLVTMDTNAQARQASKSSESTKQCPTEGNPLLAFKDSNAVKESNDDAAPKDNADTAAKADADSNTDADSVPDLDEIHKDLMLMHPPKPLDKQTLIERLLKSRNAFMDIPAHMVDLELAVIGENDRNKLSELCASVYANRDAYHNPDLVRAAANALENAAPAAATASDGDSSDVYEDAEEEEEKEEEEEDADVTVESFVSTNEEQEDIAVDVEPNVASGSGIQINCQNVSSLLEEDGDAPFVYELETIDEDIVEEIEDENAGVEKSVEEATIDEVPQTEQPEEAPKTPNECTEEETVVPEPIIDVYRIAFGFDSLEASLPSAVVNADKVDEGSLKKEKKNEIKDEVPQTEQPEEAPNTPNKGTAEPQETPPPADGPATVEAAAAAATAAAPSFDLKHLQSLVYGAPPPLYNDDPLIEAGDYGLDADQAAALTEEIKQSPAYQAHLKSLHAIDKELEEGIQRIMLEASVEFGVLQELEKNGDPLADGAAGDGSGGGGDDILKQAERYTAEFISRLDDEQRRQFHSQ